MKKKLLAMLLALAMVAGLLPGMAFAADTSGVTWSYSDGTLTIQGTGPMDDYKWDNAISFVNVPWADYCKEIRTVTIGDGVTSVGGNAFFGCGSLTRVTIPNGVTAIGEGAFANCSSLTYMTIPASVTIIGIRAFEACRSLTSVTIPDGVTAIDDAAFRYCNGLTDVTIPAGVTTIGYQAFYGCGSLKNVYYGGSKSQWDQIDIDSGDDGNAPLLSAGRYYKDVSGGTETPEIPDITFKDVPPGIWYEKAAQYVKQHGLMDGTDDGKFDPDVLLMRGMITTVLARLDGEDTKGGSTWYEKGMNWAKAKNISDGQAPERNITREELATMLWRYADMPDADVSALDSYPDVSNVDNWAKTAMAWAVENKIITGATQGGSVILDPMGTADRAQAATVIMRFCELDK